MKNIRPKIFFFFIFTILISTLFIIYHDFLSLENLNKAFISTEQKVNQNYNYCLIFFFTIYLLVAALSLPLATSLSLLIGALFNFLDAVFIISLGASLGATLSFLIARHTLKNYLEKKYNTQFEKINKGIEENGIFYLFFLRVFPVFPFFLINILFGITKIPIMNFFLVSLVGMLPGIFLYVNAGSQLSKVNTLNDIYDLKILFSIFIIGIFPFIIKKVLYFLGFIKK